MWERIAALSIRAKLLLPTMVTLVIASVFIFSYYPAQQRSQALNTLEAKVLGMGDIVSLGVAFGLARDMSAVAEAFRVAQRDSALSYIVVLDTAGGRIGEYNPAGVTLRLSDLSDQDGVFTRYGLLNVAAPIRYQDREYGMLGLGFNLEAVETSVARSKATAVFMSLALLIGGGALAVLLGNIIARPIIDLRDAAVQVARGTLDVTVPVQSADEVGALTEAFNRMTETLESTMAARAKLERLATLGQLTASVSHELRNPLGTIRISMFSIREHAKEKGLELEWTLDRVDRSLVRCDSVIADLQEFTRGMEIDRQPTNLDSWIAGVLADQPVPAGIDVMKDLGAGVEVPLDQAKMIGVMTNLMENAVQAIQSEQQTDDHSAAVGRIEVSSRRDDSRVVISVTDSGPGFPKADLAKVFEPLFTTKTRGVGLGLAIVQKIVVLHGGTVSAENGRDGGAIVTVELPLELPAS